MKLFVCFLVQISVAWSAITHGVDERNSIVRIKPVGLPIARRFLPLTEIPPPFAPPTEKSLRRSNPECADAPLQNREVYSGKKIAVFGDYYEDKLYMTVATMIFPDHIDHKHFDVTTNAPYFTVGTIQPLGFHPTTHQGDHPAECEKIYQDHLDEMYSQESVDQSEESLEMARMPTGRDSANMDNKQESDVYGDWDLRK